MEQPGTTSLFGSRERKSLQGFGLKRDETGFDHFTLWAVEHDGSCAHRSEC